MTKFIADQTLEERLQIVKETYEEFRRQVRENVALDDPQRATYQANIDLQEIIENTIERWFETVQNKDRLLVTGSLMGAAAKALELALEIQTQNPAERFKSAKSFFEGFAHLMFEKGFFALSDNDNGDEGGGGAPTDNRTIN